MPILNRPRLWSLSLLAATVSAVSMAATSGAGPGPAPRLTVMTRNLYLGADLLPLALAKPGAPFEQAVAGVLAHEVATGPAARMKLVADEIAQAKPDLVGLQEATTWKTGPIGGKPDHVVADYLKTIMAELRRRHAPYRVVVQRLSLHLQGPSSSNKEVFFTDGNAILARSGVAVSHVRTADFKHELSINTQALGRVVVARSWAALDGSFAGRRFHFVDSHLEAYDATVRLEQAQELVAGPLRSKLRTVLVGDLNSGPSLPKPEDRPPFEAISSAGFVDERTPQFNCCFSDDLRTGHWDHIVDHIMTKPKTHLVRSFITGREKTAAGLHPSDHGGVVSVLALGG